MFDDFEAKLFALTKRPLVAKAVRKDFWATDKLESEPPAKHFNSTHISVLFTTPAECKEAWAPVFCLIDPGIGADLVSKWKGARRMVNEVNEWALTSDCKTPTLEHKNDLAHNTECPHGGTVDGLVEKLNRAASGGPPVAVKPKELDKKLRAQFPDLFKTP